MEIGTNNPELTQTKQQRIQSFQILILEATKMK